MNPIMLPLVAAQGLWVRRRVEVLPEASGPTSGMTAGNGGAPLRLVVVGESTAAGCGAPTHDEAFTGAFADALAGRQDHPVAWRVHGRHGATIRRVRHQILPHVEAGSDVAVLLIGVNDVLTQTSSQQWNDDLIVVMNMLTQRAERVVIAGIPPFDSFPSLPQALRRYLARRGRAFDDISRTLSKSHPTVSWIDSTDLAPAEAEFFARDGFRPSPAGYQRWAQALSDRITY